MNPSSRPPYDIHDADYEQILDDLPAAPINRKSGLLSGPAGLLPLIESLSYAAGFLTASAGVIQISAFYALYKAKLSGAGWVLAGGILNLLLSVVILLNPIVSWFSLTALWGVYLLVSAIALSAESWSGRRAVRF